MFETPGLDELTPIANYMANEINRNAAGRLARRMRELNATTASACIRDFTEASFFQQLFRLTPQQCVSIEISSHQAAYMMWTGAVMQNAEWDHKPKIRKLFKSSTTGTGVWHAWGDERFFYDVWSNVHYGYVGRAAGFSASALLDGAGLEQIGSTALRGKMPTRTPGVSGMRAFDDAPDRASITIGVEMHAKSPRGVTPYALLDRIVNSPDVSREPL